MAEQFANSKAGRTGNAINCPTFDVDTLLKIAGCEQGELRELAERDLEEARKAGLVECVYLSPKDRSRMISIRVPLENELRLFQMVGLCPPSEIRKNFAAQFALAATFPIRDRWENAWKNWCEHQNAAALAGESICYFKRDTLEQNEKLLKLLPQLLSWDGESLIRFASCVLCGNSKTLESLATKEQDGEFRGKLRGKIGKLLEEITGGHIRTLDDLGILPNPRFVLLHGPIRLRLDGAWLDLSPLHGAFRLSETDIDLAEDIFVTAKRCLTVENEASFHELAKLRSGELIIQTSFPGSATVKLLQRLPTELEFWHFGDTDKDGFEILRVLSEKSGRTFKPLHMQPGRNHFEQESLGRPRISHWPFY
ncbi:MAG TPA: Wadjet anti-phage system protein JetD domain-containing protein [Verrucomicrobiae bacterium]|nr:Wadjet anti-phage system protein JetD domain-containing protein [Verrucomicrobiae bacterium]